MTQMTLTIDGMACGMCEAHVNDAVRRAFAVKKVTASHKTGVMRIIAEEPIEEAALRRTIDATGYRVLTVSAAPYRKKGFSPFGKRG